MQSGKLRPQAAESLFGHCLPFRLTPADHSSILQTMYSISRSKIIGNGRGSKIGTTGETDVVKAGTTP